MEMNIEIDWDRIFENQKAEGLMKCDILNRMVSLGMPESERMC